MLRVVKDVIISDSAYELRRNARNELDGRWLKIFVGFLCYYAVINLVLAVLSALFPGQVHSNITGTDMVVPGISLVYMLIVFGPMQLGLATFALAYVHEHEIRLSLLFDGFNKLFKSIGLAVCKMLLIVWPMLIVLLAGTAYLLTYIATDNTNSYFIFGHIWSIAILTALFTGFVVAVIYMVITSLRYSLVFFILSDDRTKGIGDCLRQSRKMMHGNKQKLFMTYMTFIGWIALAQIPALGLYAITSFLFPNASDQLLSLPSAVALIVSYVPMVFLQEYMYTLTVKFYELVKENSLAFDIAEPLEITA